MALDAGTLTVTLQYGKDLKDRDWFGRQDPYVKLRIGNQERRTKTAIDGGKNPVWNQTFEFSVINENSLELTVMDEDTLSRDDLIGTCSISLARAREMNGGTDIVQAPVFCKRKNKQHGFVQVTLTFNSNSKLRPHSAAYAPPAYAPPPQPHPYAYAYPQAPPPQQMPYSYTMPPTYGQPAYAPPPAPVPQPSPSFAYPQQPQPYQQAPPQPPYGGYAPPPPQQPTSSYQSYPPPQFASAPSAYPPAPVVSPPPAYPAAPSAPQPGPMPSYYGAAPAAPIAAGYYR